MKWTEDTTFKFVKEYLGHACLYNTKCSNYRNKFARHAALAKICEIMNIPDFRIREAQAKIKSIRSTYSQERKKINDSRKSGMGTDELYVPCLKWYKLYHGCMKQKDLTQVIKQDNSDSAEMKNTEETKNNNLPNKPIYCRKRNLAHIDNLVKRVKAAGEMVQKPLQSVQQDNEFEIFGKGVAAQLNAMPLIDALQAQTHIQNYLTNIRVQSLRQLDSTNYSPSPPSTTTYISTSSPVGEIILSDNVDMTHEN